MEERGQTLTRIVLHRRVFHALLTMLPRERSGYDVEMFGIPLFIDDFGETTNGEYLVRFEGLGGNFISAVRQRDLGQSRGYRITDSMYQEMTSRMGSRVQVASAGRRFGRSMLDSMDSLRGARVDATVSDDLSTSLSDMMDYQSEAASSLAYAWSREYLARQTSPSTSRATARFPVPSQTADPIAQIMNNCRNLTDEQLQDARKALLQEAKRRKHAAEHGDQDTNTNDISNGDHERHDDGAVRADVNVGGSEARL